MTPEDIEVRDLAIAKIQSELGKLGGDTLQAKLLSKARRVLLMQ